MGKGERIPKMNDVSITKQYEQTPDGVNITKAQLVSANILSVEVQENGIKGGDAGHGGFVKIKLTDDACTSMEARVNGDALREAEVVEIVFRGDTERDTLREALKSVVDALDTRVAQ
tara:strand:- start:595 stop:945 length:351 start_codon:yes stop_codon:yes gene_type:complete